MKCTEDSREDCDNIDLKRCEACVAPMLCLCQRPEVREMIKNKWLPIKEEDRS